MNDNWVDNKKLKELMEKRNKEMMKN